MTIGIILVIRPFSNIGLTVTNIMSSNNKGFSLNLNPLLPQFTSCLALHLYNISCILIILQHLISFHLGLNDINLFCNINISRTIFLLKLLLLIYCLAITARLINPIINYCSRDNLCLFIFLYVCIYGIYF